MTREEFGELHRLLALIYYENVKMLNNTTNNSVKKECENNINAINRIMKLVIVDGENE